MCWRCNKSHFAVKTADRAIPVYKIVRGNAESLYFSYMWVLGFHTLAAKLKFEDHYGTMLARRAFHSYSEDCLYLPHRIDDHPFSFEIRSPMNSEFRHVLLDTFLYNESPLLVMKCAIPKGAEYARNSIGEYVSNQMFVQYYIRAFGGDPEHVYGESTPLTFEGMARRALPCDTIRTNVC